MSRRLARALWYAGSPVRTALVAPIQLYRWTFSGMFGGNCRFYPSCSEYAVLAIERNGAARGLALAVWRVLRCSPLSEGGVEHPPAGRTWRELHGEVEGSGSIRARPQLDDAPHGSGVRA